MNQEQSPKCEECQGRTIEFSGARYNLNYRVCTQWEKPGHKTEDEINAELRAMRNRHAPASGRFG